MTALLVFILVATVSLAAAESGRYEQELSGPGWKLWLDREAEWENDELFLPSVDISEIPSNPPSCGWDNLISMNRKNISLSKQSLIN